MGTKRKFKAKRSLSSLPKGLVHKKGRDADPGNPFEVSGRSSRGKQKHVVHNRPINKPKSTKHALENLQRRQSQLRSSIKSTKKANVFVDKRIGQYDNTMSADDRMLARLVKERTRQSQRTSKYRLDDDDDDGNLLTHKGEKLDPNTSEVIYSDDEDARGQLEAVDTELHFGGAGMSNRRADPYGGSSTSNLSQVYNQRKTELDDLISRRKLMKAEKMQAKETQIETIEKMDESFAELSELLSYRKNEKRPLIVKQTQAEKEMNEWNQELKQLMMKPKRKATDRTKTVEEIAKEEAERLHELETRRMARMNGDFDEDDFSDISVDDYRGSKKRKSKKKKRVDKTNRNPDELSDSDNESDDDEPKAVFTADGLQYVDKEGRAVTNDDSDGSDSDHEDDANTDDHPLKEGTRVKGNYHAAEQFDSQDAWYDGVIKRVHVDAKGAVTYDVDYDDGDFEEGMIPEHVRAVAKSEEEVEKDQEKSETELEEKFKRNKARDKARNEMPFIFEVTTTLDGLHEVIAKYATKGEDASTIIERMYKANSVRLDHRNKEKMQNFYDVLLRRYMSVGDAIFVSGDGGEELGRFSQLDSLLKVMYKMAQDSPESAGAVWSRRIGFLQSAHAKRLRDAEFEYEDDGDDGLVTAWPSMGNFLLLRAVGHIFPVTDKKHHVVIPTMLLLGQMVAHTPVTCSYDLVMGILCSGLLIEYTKDAKRIVPEALAFLAGVMRLFSKSPGFFALPSLGVAKNVPSIQALRDGLSKAKLGDQDLPKLALTSDFIVDGKVEDLSTAILFAALDLTETCANALEGSFTIPVEAEVFSELSESILTLPKRGTPNALQQKIASTASKLASMCPKMRTPVCRQGASKQTESAIKSLAPRMEDPSQYSMSKDKGKKAVQVAIDRTRREYKREHKAISRELRLDGQFIEKERRDEHDGRVSKARAKRHKNFAWMEGEHASMNEQVRQGGGLLRGGGMGLAKAKAATGKMGIKKGGRLKSGRR